VTEKASPRAPLEIGLALPGLPAGEEAYVIVAAVDQGILNLTRYQPPDPDGWYFGQRRLGMELRDLYGQLIDRMQGVPGAVRSGGDGGMMSIQGPPPTEELVAFFSGVVRVDDQGRAQIRFDIPDFNGTVRVMAMSWSKSGVGHAVKDVLVRDPIVVSAALPRFLAPEDRSRLQVELTHVEGPAGDMSLSLETSAGHVTIPASSTTRMVQLAQGGQARVEVPLTAQTVGDETLAIRLRTPDGRDLVKTLTLGVRANAPAMSETKAIPLPSGREATIGANALVNLVPGTDSALISVGGIGRLDIPGVLMALDRYPYGCSEQLVSRALPLLYLDEVALAAGLPEDANAKERVRRAIGEVLANQSSSGGFGAWGVYGDDAWLDAYVTDFLTRARERGYQVPAVAFDNAVDNLRNRLSYVGDFSEGGQNVAYDLYVLARNGRAAIGDLRYYAETKLSAFATPLAKAQIAAGLALYGDRPRADAAFRAALTDLDGGTDDGNAWRMDYGSALRDAAALLTLAAEAGTGALDLNSLAKRVEARRDAARYTSTQDDAWVLLATHALMQGAARPELAIDGQAVAGPLYRRLDGANLLARPLVVANRGTGPEEVLVTVTGVPLVAPPAGGSGYRIERAYYDLEGRRVELDNIVQGARLVAVLTVTADGPRQARLILDDPLPAGFEIENPNLLKAGDLSAIPWLGLEETAAHTEFRSDRFIAALDRGPEDSAQFQLAYRLRAISPGTFTQPAASVEDMYRPQKRAWTGTRVFEVRPTGRGN
jgi:alpha-2-macroglobulin